MTATVEVNVVHDNDSDHVVCEPVKAPGRFFTVPAACLGSVVDEDSMKKATVEIGRLQNLCADRHEEIVRLQAQIATIQSAQQRDLSSPSPVVSGAGGSVSQGTPQA